MTLAVQNRFDHVSTLEAFFQCVNYSVTLDEIMPFANALANRLKDL